MSVSAEGGRFNGRRALQRKASVFANGRRFHERQAFSRRRQAAVRRLI